MSAADEGPIGSIDNRSLSLAVLQLDARVRSPFLFLFPSSFLLIRTTVFARNVPVHDTCEFLLPRCDTSAFVARTFIVHPVLLHPLRALMSMETLVALVVLQFRASQQELSVLKQQFVELEKDHKLQTAQLKDDVTKVRYDERGIPFRRPFLEMNARGSMSSTCVCVASFIFIFHHSRGPFRNADQDRRGGA